MDLSDRAASFFEAYVTAFETMDAAEIVRHFAFPLHMTSDGDDVELASIPDADTWRGEIGRLVGFYRDIGAASARIVAGRSVELSPRVEHAAVHWQLEDARGDDLYDFHAVYTLVDSNGATRIAALAHDELPRALGFAAGRS